MSKCCGCLFIFYLLYFSFICSAITLELDEYLNKKFKYLQDTFDEKTYSLYRRDSDSVVMQKSSHERMLPELTNYIKIIFWPNHMHIIAKKGIYEIFNNSTIFLRQDKNRLENITFAKSIIFNDIGFIIIHSDHTKDSYIYHFTNGIYKLVQTIGAPDARDSHFFINNNNIYLVVANNKGNGLAETSIYKWLGFYFDEIQTAFTTGAIKVGSFTTRSAEIIIILQDTPNKAILSAVFEFSNEKLKKIQQLKIYRPVNLNSYSSKNKKYIIIFTQTGRNLIYEWNDFQLVASNSFQTENVVDNSQILKLNNTSVLQIASQKNLQIYRLNNEKITLKSEIKWLSNFSKIIDIQLVKNGSTYIIGLNTKNLTIMSTIYLTFNFIETKSTLSDTDEIRNCFNTLEIKMQNLNIKLNDTKNKLRSENKIKLLSESLIQEPAIDNQIQKLKNKLTNLNSIMTNYTVPENNNVIINGKVIFKSNVKAKKITGNNMVLKIINEQKWNPEQWLRYKKPQTVSGLSKIKIILANHVETSSNDPIFRNLLQKNKDEVINKSIAIDFLTVSKLYAKNINSISMKNVYKKSKPKKITGIKSFKHLHIDYAKMAAINENMPDVIISSVISAFSNLDLSSNITIGNLDVDTINGVSWNKFKNSVFRINITKEIKGPLTFSKIKAKNLNIKKIKDIDVANLLTTSTDQIIESKMKFDDIFTNELHVDDINGIKIPQDVIFIYSNATVQGPVKFDKLKILGDLTLSGKFDESFFLKTDDHIIGSNESDLLQIYTGNVTINGNLHLSNLKLLPNAKVFVSETKINPIFREVYWIKNTLQKIPVHVTFVKDVTTPHMLTKVINNIKFGQYLLNNNEENIETDFKFGNVSVLGNIILENSAEHKPDLNKILETAVKTTGSYIIHDKKTYLNTLKAESLQTIELEGIKLAEGLNRKWPQNVTGTKTIRNLIINNDAVTNTSDVKIINDISLERFLQKIIFVNKLTNITHLDFENVIGIDFQAEYLNNRSMEDYLTLKKKLKTLSLITNLTLNGNVHIDHIKNISFINNVPYENLLKNTIKIGKSGIVDEAVFFGKIEVKNFVADQINDISLRNLTKKVLNRQFAQTIMAPYTFFNLKADNILTRKINNVNVENIVNTRSSLLQKIFSLNGTILLSSDTIMTYLKASKIKPCSLDKINIEITDPPTQKWKEIEIKGNVTLLDEECFLYNLFEKSAKQNSKNSIHSDVKILSHAVINSLHTKNPINRVNIPYLLEDSILRQSNKEQKITGKKWFATFQTKEAHILGNVDATFVNKENITALNKDIVVKNEENVIKGKKTFYNGLQTNKFMSKVVSSVKPENIVNLDESQMIAEALFDTLVVMGDLNVKVYNSKTFIDFIENRLVIDGAKTQVAVGIYFFKDLEVLNFTTPFMNDLLVEEVVFDIGIQNISSQKHFERPVFVNGKINVDYVNGINFTHAFISSLQFNGDVKINGSIAILKPSNISGEISTESINGFSVAVFKEILSSNLGQIETDDIFFLKEQIIEIINRSIPLVQNMQSYFMYLEKSSSLQITVPNAISASTIISNRYVLIHIFGQEAGAYCGLPSNCSCPLQYTIEVTPQNSVTMFSNRGIQRIFSYDDDSMTVNFITNSVSTSSTCRTIRSKVINDISMMTWNTKTQNNTAGLFYQHEEFLKGYISKVEFFSHNGNTYAVVGRYYDPVSDTYELDCTVLRFNNNRTRALEIQIIPTKGIQEIYLLQTAQGVILVLCNKIPSDLIHDQETTQIYRFESEKEKFNLLRTIPSFGCSSATGVVYGTDSLISLAHKEAPVQVLKYYPEFDNYYFYQSFELDEPVIKISSFYTGGFGISDAFLCLITSQEKYYIYTYRFIEGFKLKSTGKLEGLRNFAPFVLNSQTYLFASSAKFSSLLTVVKNGSS